MTKLKDTNLSFQDKEDWSIEMRTKGEVKGGGSERTENETDRLPFPPIHCGGVFRSQPVSFQKGPIKETAPWPLSARVIKPGKQSVVHHVWDCNPQVELSPTYTPVFRNLSLQPTSHGTSPGDKKLRWEYWDEQTSSHYMIWSVSSICLLSLCSAGSPLDEGLLGMRWVSLPSARHPSRWAIAGQREQVSQAERSDAVAARPPHSQMERTEKEVDFRRGKGTKGKWWVKKDKVKMLVAQLCLTLCDPMDCSPPGSPVHGILQARKLQWLTIFFSRGSSPTRDQTLILFQGDFRLILYHLCHKGSPKRTEGKWWRKKDKGRGGKHCRSEGTEAPGDWKADLANMVMLKHQEVEVDICHPPGRCVWWSWRHPYPLPRQRQLPCVGHHKVCYWPQFLSFPSQ